MGQPRGAQRERRRPHGRVAGATARRQLTHGAHRRPSQGASRSWCSVRRAKCSWASPRAGRRRCKARGIALAPAIGPWSDGRLGVQVRRTTAPRRRLRRAEVGPQEPVPAGVAEPAAQRQEERGRRGDGVAGARPRRLDRPRDHPRDVDRLAGHARHRAALVGRGGAARDDVVEVGVDRGGVSGRDGIGAGIGGQRRQLRADGGGEVGPDQPGLDRARRRSRTGAARSAARRSALRPRTCWRDRRRRRGTRGGRPSS